MARKMPTGAAPTTTDLENVKTYPRSVKSVLAEQRRPHSRDHRNRP
jgi:hypothetical protein